MVALIQQFIQIEKKFTIAKFLFETIIHLFKKYNVNH